MAVAKIKETKVTTRTVILELSEKEAGFLCSLLYCGIAGDPINWRRKLADEISEALYGAGVSFKDRKDIHGTIDIR